MSSRLPLIAAGVGAYLAFTVATFPASIAHRWFSPDELSLASVDGTVWRGSADYGAFDGMPFSDLEWQVHPVALLTGGLSLSVQASIAGGLARADMVARGSNATLTNVRGSVNLAQLSYLLPFEGITGNANVTLDQIELNDGWPVQATGAIRLDNLAGAPVIPIPGVSSLPLGSYRLQLAADGGDLVAAIVDEGGPMELTGQLRLSPDRSYRFEARIVPRPEAHNALVDGLKLLYPANAAGQHEILYQGRLQ